MDDSRAMRRRESGGNLPRERQRSCQRQRRLPLKQGSEIRSLDILHGEVERVVDLTEVVNTDDVWVRDLARELELALESRFEIAPLQCRRAGIDADQLQRDRGAERAIPGVIDLAHAAGSEQPDDRVPAAEFLPGLKPCRP